MELVYGLRHIPGDYLVEVATRGGTQLRDISSLVRAGLPTSARDRVGFSGRLDELRPTDPQEYFEAFGLETPADAKIRHQVYCCHDGDVRIVIPALAILRALFRPTHYFLPKVFYPNALERVRLVDFDRSPPGVTPLSVTWRDKARYGDLIGPLEWFSFYPSATQFLRSVYTNALGGGLAFELPSAAVKLSARGVRAGNTHFATIVTVLSLKPTEPPYPFAERRDVHLFRRATSVRSGRSPELCDPRVAKHADGSVDLTDGEWDQIEPLIETGRGRTGSRTHSRRLVMDGVLRKLGLGTGWRTTEYRTGGHINALHAYREWSKNGALDRVLEAIARMRE